ncbi:MAG: hypothetical protein ABFD89_18495 [Bryobacteraceae bacterium]
MTFRNRTTVNCHGIVEKSGALLLACLLWLSLIAWCIGLVAFAGIPLIRIAIALYPNGISSSI